MGEETLAGRVLRHLHELKDLLESNGLTCSIERTAHSMPAALLVTNPQAAFLNDVIKCRRYPSGNGSLWFYFSWDEPICPTSDVRTAAKEISRVLAVRP